MFAAKFLRSYSVNVMHIDWTDLTFRLILQLIPPLFTDYLRRRTAQAPQIISGAVVSVQGAQMCTAVGFVGAVAS